MCIHSEPKITARFIERMAKFVRRLVAIASFVVVIIQTGAQIMGVRGFDPLKICRRGQSMF